MTAEDPRTKAARGILEECGNGAVAVSKTVRSGLTTSAKEAAREMGKSILFIEPTRRILRETLGGSRGESVRVAGNVECFVLAEEIDENPILRVLPLSLPDQCGRSCPHFAECPVVEVLRHDGFEVAGLSYAKLTAVMLSGSDTAREIREIISSADFVVLDEAHLLGFGSVPSLPAESLPSVPMTYKKLRYVRNLWTDTITQHAETIAELEEAAKDGHAWRHLARTTRVDVSLDWRALKSCWAELKSWALTGEAERGDLLQLRDAIEILSSPFATLHFVSENEGDNGHIQISGSRTKDERAIWEFLHEIVPYAGHIYVSGTLVQLFDGHFTELSGKSVKSTIFPDLKHSSDRVTLIPDSWRLTSRNFPEKLSEILDQIRQIMERENEPAYLLAPNRRKAAVLRKKLKEARINDVFVDYFRSDLSIGVERNERICICIGLAELPSNACDPLAWGSDEGELWLNSRKLRLQAVHAASWQSIGRTRDPNGEVTSRVYLIGVRLDEARELAKWGPGRQVKAEEIKDDVTPDGRPYRRANFTITVEDEIERCKLFGEVAKKDRPDQRSVPEMIERVEYYDEDIIYSENRHKMPNIIYRQNVPKISFYNIPMNKSELEHDASLLELLFVNRGDCYAQQYKNVSGATWAKVPRRLSGAELKDHAAGLVTVGVYEIGLDDTVLWGCFDVDSHDGDDDGEEARAKVRALVSVLRSYGVPFMLEASGSLGSYHLWIFFEKTKTYNAHRFMRQVKSEARIKGIEIWPKQKSITSKDAKYGNLVKLPICINQKTGARSAFLDADTFEPLDGEVLVPGRVALLEVPEITSGTVDGQAGMPKALTAKPKPSSWSTFSSSSLDYCMVKMLDSGVPLVGGEGHLARVAIATKAADIGMPPLEAAVLFKDQPDFNFNISLEKATEIADRGYFPWSCESLRDKCGDYVTRWCPTCQCCRSDYSAEAVSQKNDTTKPYTTFLVRADVPSFEFGGRSWNLRRGDLVGGLPGFVVDLFLNEGALVEVGV